LKGLAGCCFQSFVRVGDHEADAGEATTT